MWKISDRLWINPAHIAHVLDTPGADTLTVYLTGKPYPLDLKEQERQVLLAYLSQHTVMHPPYLVRDDDEPPF